VGVGSLPTIDFNIVCVCLPTFRGCFISFPRFILGGSVRLEGFVCDILSV
jgi:hypothetical protein